jgi:hypothetical protein
MIRNTRHGQTHIEEDTVNNQNKHARDDAPHAEGAPGQQEEATPFFVRRLRKMPPFRTNVRAGGFCSVDDE